ncbi:ATP-dependent helicase [Lichenicoccus sp.]|uniref:ATP-dependent helicase n=1 Tax=Lichenicoccus sp. TaxID=2781899 RepID=UPI003D09C59C
MRRISTAYLEEARSLSRNPQQKAAYDSTGNCVVLAGPGSGKTKTLTLKLARILAEDIRAPRGVACITYSHECARELQRRLEGLGLQEGPNLFVGTVHGFCMRHLLLPYANLAGLPLPFPLTMAGSSQTKEIEKHAGEALFGVRHAYNAMEMGRHRRSVLNRQSEEWNAEPELSQWALRVEADLHAKGLIDFDDLVINGRKLVSEHNWVLPLVRSKFPVLVVDEYQDLGVALHAIVQRLVFDGGVRLFAVGDYDQTVYGFTGADGALLQELSERSDVEKIQLRLNYRSAGRLIQASEMVLGEERGYRASNSERAAVIDFALCPNGLRDQAAFAINKIVPSVLAAKPGRRLGDIAILYKDYNGGNAAARAALAAGQSFVRVDNSAPYRKVALTSWIEDCAAWCAGGWRHADPRLLGLIDQWLGFHANCAGDNDRQKASLSLSRFLWAHRQDDAAASTFVSAIRRDLLDVLMANQPSLGDQAQEVEKLTSSLTIGGPLVGFSTRELGKQDGSPDHLNLLTLHSSKGCEYDVVIMLGLDQGALPWKNATQRQIAADRRLFYVGLTRARDAAYMLYSGWIQTRNGRWTLGRSIFVDELETRLSVASSAASTSG